MTIPKPNPGMQRQRRVQHPLTFLLIILALVAAACGGGGGDTPGDAGGEPGGESSSSSEDELEDPLASAVGAGGGGTLVFDGEEIAIESVVCALRGEVVDVGTISDTGHRVLIGTNSSANPISAQVLDPDFLQWFPQGVSGDEAQRDGDTFTSGPTPYFNNSDDRIVEVSFTVECP